MGSSIPTTLTEFANRGYATAREQVFIVAFMDKNFVHRARDGSLSSRLECGTSDLVLTAGRGKGGSPIAFCWDVRCVAPGGSCGAYGRFRLERCGLCGTFNSRMIYEWVCISPSPSVGTIPMATAYCSTCNRSGYYENGEYKERPTAVGEAVVPPTTFQAPQINDAAVRARGLILR